MSEHVRKSSAYWSKKSWSAPARSQSGIPSRLCILIPAQMHPLGLRMSHPSQHVAQVIFCVRGVYTPVLAKHSKHFYLEDSLAIGVDRMQRNFGASEAAGRGMAGAAAALAARFGRDEVGQEPSNAAPSPHTPIATAEKGAHGANQNLRKSHYP